MAKNLSKVILILLCTDYSMVSAMENVSGQGQQPYLFIRNGSNWVISVFWQTADGRNFNTVVSAQKSEKLDALANIEKLEIRAYGKYWGYLAKKYGIPLQPIKRDQSSYDGSVHIGASYWPWTWNFEYMRSLYKENELMPEALKDAFPGVERVQPGQPILPHHVLNIDPSNVTEEILRNSFARLLARWEQVRANFYDQEAIGKIIAKLVIAYKALKRELIVDPGHTERFVFNPKEFSKKFDHDEKYYSNCAKGIQ